MQEALPHVMLDSAAFGKTGQRILLGLSPLFPATEEGHRGSEVSLREWNSVKGQANGQGEGEKG
jgi:hypothetical protein